MPKKIIKTTKKRVKKMRPKGVRPVKPQKFLEIMGRLELIDEEVKKEAELFDIKMKSLELEKQYLWNIIKPKKRRVKK